MNNLIVLTTPIEKETVKRNFTNKPEKRHENIYNCLNQLNCKIFLQKLNLTLELLLKLNVHNPNMLICLKNCYKSFEDDPDEGFLEYFKDGIIPYTFARTKLKQSKITKLKYWQQLGCFANDVFTPIFKDTWKNALKSANNCYNVKDYLIPNMRQTIYCLNLYPGHHTGRNNFGGYCFLNNAGICAKTLLDFEIASKIAILDLDYHAGDGTADIFKEDPRITTISIHANTNYDYPYYTCDDEDSDDIFYNKFISFNPHTTPEDYHKCVKIAIDYLNNDKPDVLIVAFGGDTYFNDPDASVSCRCSLDIVNYYNIGLQIRKSFQSTPIVVTQEGGYNIENIAEISKSFLEGLL